MHGSDSLDSARSGNQDLFPGSCVTRFAPVNNTCWPRSLFFFFFFRARPSALNVVSRSLEKKKKKNYCLGGLSFLMSNTLAFLGRDMAVDLGTANTLVYVAGGGSCSTNPPWSRRKTKGKIVGVGLEAKRMIGRTPGNIVAVRPMKDGVIADFDVTERMLRYFIFMKSPSQQAGQTARWVWPCQRHHRGGAERRQGSRPSGGRAARVHHRGADGGGDRAGLPVESRQATWWSTSAAVPPRSP